VISVIKIPTKTFTFFKCNWDLRFVRYAYIKHVTAATSRLVRIRSFSGLESDFGGPNNTASIAFKVIFDLWIALVTPTTLAKYPVLTATWGRRDPFTPWRRNWSAYWGSSTCDPDNQLEIHWIIICRWYRTCFIYYPWLRF